MKRASFIIFILAIAFIAFTLGQRSEGISLYSKHTRFTREVFFRLDLLPKEELSKRVKVLTTEFEFPATYSESEETRQTGELFRKFGIDDNTVNINQP